MQKNSWVIKCNHTPETIDRIMVPFRKRGMMLDSLSYNKVADGSLAECKLEFTQDALQAEQIYKNLLRTVDVEAIEIQN